MTMLSFLVTVALLGLAGFDPSPMVIGLAALASGVKRRRVIVFGVILLAGTAIWGFVLSRIAGETLANLDWHYWLREHPLAVWVELILALGSIAFGAWRFGKPVSMDDESRSKGRSLYLVALAFIALVITDPVFPIAVVVASEQHWVPAAIAMTMWAVLSQFPLLILVVVLIVRPRGRGVRMLRNWWHRFGPSVIKAGLLMLILGGLVMLVDVIVHFVTGHFLIVP